MNKKAYFDEDEVMNLIIQILLALECMHSNMILHRDLKPDNIFLSTKGKLKIGDFGISRVFNPDREFTIT